MKISDLPRFKDALSLAKRNRYAQFTFDGKAVLVTYADYLVQYLERGKLPASRAWEC